MSSTTTNTTDPTTDATPEIATPVPPVRRRSVRLVAAGSAVAVLAGIGALGITVLTGTDSPRPAVVVSQPAAESHAPQSSSAATAPVDIDALWQTILQLNADQVAVIVPALDPQVRADLEAIVHAVAGAAAS